jgi:hypothetical protein
MEIIELLKRLYPEEEIFVHNPSFDRNLPILKVVCMVPKGKGYAVKPVPYVTAENYVRILSQASYLLAFHIIQNNILDIKISVKDFLQALDGFQLYYRNLSLIFHERVEKGRVFEMELNLKNARVIRSLHDFIIFTFTNKRTVISGEMSFVYVG